MQNPKSLSRWWLLLGCWSVALAGLFSLVLVIARTPQLASMPVFTRLFHEALVVHVDLSVLVWFLALACLLWSLMIRGTRCVMPYLEESAILCMGGGMLFLTLSPLDPKGEAMMSNYIPVIHSPVFFIGLALIFCSVALMLARLFMARRTSHFFTSPAQTYGLYVAGLVTFMSLCAFAWSYTLMPAVLDGTQYYEVLFWGGGHVLQFTHTQILIISWWMLIAALAPDFKPSNRAMYFVLSISLAAVFFPPLGYLGTDITSARHRQFFTDLMIHFNGLPTIFFLFFLLKPLWNSRQERKGSMRALWSCLIMSLLLYIYGGVLGHMIHGQNVVIPAHYHGSIVGITLAFMGVAYLLLPHFGYRKVAGWKLAYWQPIVYGAGQILHISGLAYSGGYGVLRKTPGVVTEVAPSVKIALGLMGGGGLIAIIGGVMFVIVAAKAVYCHSDRA